MNLSPTSDPVYQFAHDATADLHDLLAALHTLLVSGVPASRTGKDPIISFQIGFTIDSAASEKPKADREGFNWFGATVTAAPLLFVAGHLLWPAQRWLHIVANVTVLLLGTLMLSALRARLARGKAVESEDFPLPVATIGMVTLLGGVLMYFFSWASTAAVLGSYGVLVMVPALRRRARPRQE